MDTEVDVLILTRKFDEKVILSWRDHTVTVVVCGILGDNVRLGFDAPPDVSIDREEVFNKIQDQGGRRIGGKLDG